MDIQWVYRIDFIHQAQVVVFTALEKKFRNGGNFNQGLE